MWIFGGENEKVVKFSTESIEMKDLIQQSPKRSSNSDTNVIRINPQTPKINMIGKESHPKDAPLGFNLKQSIRL